MGEGEGNEGTGKGVDDLFSGGSGNRGAAGVMPGPAQPTARTLEKTLTAEGAEATEPASEDPMVDLTGGYSAEAHRATLAKVRDAKKKRLTQEEKAVEYWAKTDRKIAESMQIAPGAVMTAVYNALGHIGVNLYKRDARKAMAALRAEADKVQKDINKLESRMQGKVDYVSPIAGHASEEAMESRKFVREPDKGLRYKLAESVDEARILGYQYRNGLRALERFRKQIPTQENNIRGLQSNTSDPSAPAKVSNLQAELANIQREKTELEVEQREYEQELSDYEKKTDRLQAKASLYGCIVRRGNRKIRQLEAGIDILADYIQERADLVTVHDLLGSLNAIDEEHGRINETIRVYDGVVGEQLEHLQHVVESNDMEYSTRPLMKQVDGMDKQDQVATQKDMGRILGKLGITI